MSSLSPLPPEEDDPQFWRFLGVASFAIAVAIVLAAIGCEVAAWLLKRIFG